MKSVTRSLGSVVEGNCKFCDVPMISGKALTHDVRLRTAWRVGAQVITSFLSLGKTRDCLKCPMCGYSRNL